MKTLTVRPAYGRHYTNALAATTDWQEGKDFKIISSGPYVSLSEKLMLIRDGYTHIKICYNAFSSTGVTFQL